MWWKAGWKFEGVNQAANIKINHDKYKWAYQLGVSKIIDSVIRFWLVDTL